MKISVIVPVYNTEKYLKRCIESILGQTYRDLEVILVDDGSTDKSGEICDYFENIDQRVKIYHIKNGGVSHARNVGMDNATGTYIAFVDSDDYIRCDMYEKLLWIAEQFDVDVVSSDLIIDGRAVENNVEARTCFDKTRIQNEVLPLFTYSGSIGTMAFTNKIFRYNAIQQIRFYEGFSYQEDLMFMINVYGNINSFYYLPEIFYEYYPLGTGLYCSYRENAGQKFIEARKEILKLINQYSINICKENFDNSFLYNICFYIYRTCSRKSLGKERKRLISEVLNSPIVLTCCEDILKKASSFDRRIAYLICRKNYIFAVFLIKFVYSGKAGKLQQIITKLRK